MRYVLLGTLEAQWASKQKERVKKAQAKLKELGMTVQSIYYTQGPYDFVDVVEAPNPEAMLPSRSGAHPRAWAASRACRPSMAMPSKPRSSARAHSGR
jgi:hypothetical protein